MLTLFFWLEPNKYRISMVPQTYFNADKQLKVEFCFSDSLNLWIVYIIFLIFIQKLYF